MAVVVGISAATFRGSADGPADPGEVLGDAGLSRSHGNTRVAHLDTGPIAPGDTITTGIAILHGARVTDVMPAGQFSIQSQTHTDRPDATWYEVTARNEGPVPLRFIAFISFDVPTTDGGI